jgi:enoyl-CoA hydratase
MSDISSILHRFDGTVNTLLTNAHLRHRLGAMKASLSDDDVVTFDRIDQVGYLAINRPDQRNALSTAVLAGLRRGVAAAKSDSDIRILVIRGAGDEAFCAGGDLQQMNQGAADEFAAHVGRSQLAYLFRDLWELGKPTIARVPGFALAGGFGLAAACDFIVASERAVFGLPEVKVGLWPYMITVPLLHWMHPKQVLNLMLTGRQLRADEAQRLGLVSDVAPHGEIDAAVARLVDALSVAAPQAIALGRTALYSVANHDVDSRLRMLEALLSVNLDMPDAREGLAAFAEKRSPNWRPAK